VGQGLKEVGLELTECVLHLDISTGYIRSIEYNMEPLAEQF
jgi:hypothetical protein